VEDHADEKSQQAILSEQEGDLTKESEARTEQANSSALQEGDQEG
jgi:hypothetical protein